MVWERLGKQTNRGYRTINGPVLVEANLSPQNIKFTTANESKCIFIYTGSSRVAHPNLMAITKARVSTFYSLITSILKSVLSQNPHATNPL